MTNQIFAKANEWIYSMLILRIYFCRSPINILFIQIDKNDSIKKLNSIIHDKCWFILSSLLLIRFKIKKKITFLIGFLKRLLFIHSLSLYIIYITL